VAQQRGFNEADFVLRQFAQETGGKAFFPTTATQLPDIYAQIASELSSQYLIGYASNNSRRDGQWRRVVVQVDRPDALARTKQGYYGPTQ
jgi:Ca-activated chloride channel homolog